MGVECSKDQRQQPKIGMSKELQALEMTDGASCPAVCSPTSTYEIACMISLSEGAVNNSLIIPLVRAPPSYHAHDAEHRSHQLGKGKEVCQRAPLFRTTG